MTNPVHCAPTGSRIRAWVGATLIVDSREAVLLRHSASDLVYGFPPGGRLAGDLRPTRQRDLSSSEQRFDLVVGGRRVPGAVFRLFDPPEGIPAHLQHHEFLLFAAMDAWYEEDEPLLCHPRDPFTRVDVRRSSRRIRVTAGGIRVAETERPLLLFETGLPVRYYIPWADVRTEVLAPSDHETVCCYKGRARYWHIDTPHGRYPNAAWDYPDPLKDGEPVRDAVCFYQTALSLYLDGVLEARAPHFFTR